MTKFRMIPSLLAVALGLGASVAWGNDTAELKKQVEQLQAQVQNLQTQRAQPSYSTADVDAVVDSVVRDADRRSQLLAEAGGFTGGYIDDKFTIRSADGNYSMSPGVHFQFRNVTNMTDNGKGEDYLMQNGFEVRRLKFSLEGNAISKSLYYNFVWATDRKGGNMVNEEAYIKYQLNDSFSVKLGQYKELIYQECQTSSKFQAAVDRSIVAEYLFLGDTYTQGVELIYDDKNAIQASVAFTDGFNSRNTNWQDPPQNPASSSVSFDWGVHGRAQYKVFGDWKSYRDFSAMKNSKDLLVIGAGGDWSQNGDTSILRYAFDAQYEVGSLGLFAAWSGRCTNTNGDNTHDYGLVAQATYYMGGQWEVFGRYAYLKLEESVNGEDAFHEATLGVNYYLRGHAAKFTFDFGWLCNGSPSAMDGIGVESSPGDSQFYIRGQFQLIL